jgi:purine-binding chemotaxis protein CheW
MKTTLKPAVMAAINRQQSLLYLTLILGHEIFAWDGLLVRDVVDYDDMTEMAGMPPFICGGVAWSGEAVPVVDLEARMTRQTTRITERTRIVILEMAQGGVRQLLGVVMNPASPAHDLLRAAADVRRTLSKMMAPNFGDADRLPACRRPSARPASPVRTSRHCVPAE